MSLPEREARNFGENVRFSGKLLSDSGSLAFFTKPNPGLRVLPAVPARQPDIQFNVPPAFSFPKELSSMIGPFDLMQWQEVSTR